jgi:hypothetical protein
VRALVCTVGQRDLTLVGQTASDRKVSTRAFGAQARREYATLRDRLEAPIIGRALDYLRQVDAFPDEVVLTASDQPVGSQNRDGDTCEIGAVLKTYLEERHCIRKVWLKRIQGNPADLDTVMAAVRCWLLEWSHQYTWIDLLLTGGTPAMTTGSLLSALDICPDKVTPLYVPWSGPVRPLDVVQRVRAGQRQRDIRTALDDRRFAAAVALVRTGADEVGVAESRRGPLEHVLAGTAQRLSFSLEEARRGLGRARQVARLSDDLYQRIDDLRAGIPTDSDTSGLLRELYYNANLKLRHEEYADFVLRAFNFQQAALLQAAQRAGVVFERDGELLEEGWLEAETRFAGFAREWREPATGTPVELNSRRATGPVLLCLSTYLTHEGKISPEVYKAARRIQPLATLRNKCFAAHHFRPVGRPELERAFGGSPEELLDTMATLYRAATACEIGPDPFATTVELCKSLLAASEV